MLKNPLIVAIDKNNLNEAKELCFEIKDEVGLFKLGLEFFYSFGKEGVNEIAKLGVPIFLDLKLHDIPNTVIKSSIAVLKDLKGIEMLTLHASGGIEMMQKTNEALKENYKKKPMLLGITVLTSTQGVTHNENKVHFPFALGILRAINKLKKLEADNHTKAFIHTKIKAMVKTANNTLFYWVNLYKKEEERIEEVNKLLEVFDLKMELNPNVEGFYRTNYLNGGILNEVLHLSKLSSESGIEGIVCSPLETQFVKTFYSNLKIITPGIRPIWYNVKDDQSRTLTPKEAIQQGADYLVIGRPITTSSNPKEAIKKTLVEIQG